MGKMLLDPNAVAYTDDEIVGKVNTAAANITRTDAVEEAALKESATFQKITEADETKLAGVEDGATTDQTGAEIKTAYEAEANAYTDTKDTKLTGVEDGAEANQDDAEIISQINSAAVPITREGALSQVDLKLVKSEPIVGEHRVNYVVRKADGKMEADYEDTPES